MTIGFLLFCPDKIAGQADPDLPGCGNYLKINGESNVNQFSFVYNARNDKSGRHEAHQETIEIKIPIKEFRTSNPMMYQDFLNLMKEDKHPVIRVTISRNQLENWLSDDQNPCPELNITIAGITRKYQIDCSISQCSEKLYLRGEQLLHLTDFRLKPPEKLMGLVKVNDEINVDFGFIINFTPANELTKKF